MDTFARWVVKLRLWIIVTTVLLTAASAFAIYKWSYIEADFSKYLPADDPVVKRFNEAGDRFGGVAVAMVGVEFDDVFSTQALKKIAEVSSEVKKIKGVTWVVSMTEMDDVQSEEIDGEQSVSLSPVVDADNIPGTRQELSRLREYVLNKEGLVGVIVSKDGKLANITFGIDRQADRVEVAKAVQNRVRKMLAGATLYFAGFPYWMKSMSEIILSDMMTLVPIVTILVILILFLSFMSIRGVLLPMLTVLVSSTWAMGLMAVLHIPITMLSNVIPVLLIALGTAYAIHLLHRVDELKGEPGEDYGSHLRKTMVDVMAPIGLAGLTTVIGFLSFMTSNLVFIQDFGLMSAFGIFSAMVVALTLLPSILSYLKPTRHQVEKSGGGWSVVLLESLGRFAIKRKAAVLVVAVCVSAAVGAFIPGLDRKFDMITYFPRDSSVRKSDEMMKNRLGGNVPIWITVDGDIKDPYVLKTMFTAEKYLRHFPDVSNVRSVAGILAEMNKVMTGHEAIPDTKEGVGNLWFNLEGKQVLAQFVDKDKTHALIQGVSSSSDTSRLRVMVAQIDDFLRQLPQAAMRVELGKISAEKKTEAIEERLRQVAWNVELDLQKRLPEIRSTREMVLKWLRDADKSPGKLNAKDYESRIMTYLDSDEADMEIEDPGTRKSLAAEVAGQAEKGRADQESIKEIIRRIVPENIIQQDPQGVGFLAKSLLVVIDQRRSEYKLEWLSKAMLAHLPKTAVADKLLMDELRGDLWPLCSTTAWIPVEAATDSTREVSKATFQQTGMHHISVNVDNRLVYSQLSSLGLAALLAMVLLMLQFRSFLAGLLGMIPMVMTLLINFGTMALMKIDLDSSTVLIASLVVGVGIDYTIHFMSRTRLEMMRSGEPASAIMVAQRTSGRAIMINAITVISGQLVFLAGEMIPLHYFGALLSLAMITSALASVTVMPAVLMATKPAFLQGPSRGGTKPPAQQS